VADDAGDCACFSAVACCCSTPAQARSAAACARSTCDWSRELELCDEGGLEAISRQAALGRLA